MTGPACSPARRAFDAGRSIRSRRLFSILTGRLGCDIRQGKGSALMFRAGGHHFRLGPGHHKWNTYVPTVVIKSLLDHVNITFDEWLASTS